jgi:hypothetical protein
MSDHPNNKAELLERIGSSYAALEAALGRLDASQLTAPIDGTWSAKDMLAHVTAWEQIMLHFHAGGQPFERASGLAGVPYASTPVDTINEALYQRDRARPLDEVLAAFRRSHQELLAALDGMSEADLQREYTPPGRDASSTGKLIDWVIGDTYEHYDEHRETIERAFAR